MGLIQHAIEASGIATVSLSILRAATSKIRPPRAVSVRWRFGHPLGEPFNNAQQRTIIRQALAALCVATPGALVEMSYRWRRERYTESTDWSRAPGEG